MFSKLIKNRKQIIDVLRKTTIAAGCLAATHHTIVEGKLFQNYFPTGGIAFFSECEGPSSYDLARTGDATAVKHRSVSPMVSFSYPANNPSEVQNGGRLQ